MDQVLTVEVVQNFGNPFTICSVYKDQRFPIYGNQSSKCGFDHKGSASLQRDTNVTCFCRCDFKKLHSDTSIDFNEIGITGTPVMKHHLFGFLGSGERSWS